MFPHIIGGVSCPLTSISTTELVCNLGTNSGLLPNVPYSIEVSVKNIGYALQSAAFKLTFKPVITSLAPTLGFFIIIYIVIVIETF